MGAAITLLVILTVSVFIVRVAAVALRLTGMPAEVARFQARSAFSGTGFTTSESEAIVNHPIRRRLIGLYRDAEAASADAISKHVTELETEIERSYDSLKTKPRRRRPDADVA